LAARLCQDTLGVLMRSPRPVAAMGGLLVMGGKEGEGVEERGPT